MERDSDFVKPPGATTESPWGNIQHFDIRDAKRDEKEALKTKAWDLWLNCLSEREVAEQLGVDHKTVGKWCGEKSDELGISPPGATTDAPWGNVQHFDIWQSSNGHPS